MFIRLSTVFAFAVTIFLAASTSASAGNCGKGVGNGNGTRPTACPPNKHGVPAPIAGVGLPFLIMGVVAYRRRRKSDSDGAS